MPLTLTDSHCFGSPVPFPSLEFNCALKRNKTQSYLDTAVLIVVVHRLEHQDITVILSGCTADDIARKCQSVSLLLTLVRLHMQT